MEENSQFSNIDEYIELFPNEVQEKLQQLRNIIKEIVPDVVETISWRMPTFKFRNENLVHMAAYKNHIGIYPGPIAIVEFEKELSEYKTSKGAIQFQLDKQIPFDLIKKIIEFRIKNII